MSITRRHFIKNSLSGLAWMFPAQQMFALAAAARSNHNSRILVVVQLKGGNDGLNMVVPYGIGTYYDARPCLAVQERDVLPLSNQIGFHPSMSSLARLYKQGQVAVVQNVGYPDPSRSHCRASDIWHTAEPDQTSNTGWLGRYLALKMESESKAMSHRLTAVTAALPLPRILLSNKTIVQYPNNKLGLALKFIAQMICLGADSTVYFASLDGFDTHLNQAKTQPPLLKQLSDSLLAFQSDLSLNHSGDDVITLVFSEFGRRLVENVEGGTDHGTAGPVLLVGNKVRGGIYGDHASLTNVSCGDLKFKIDFRTIYATVLDRWLSSDSVKILRQRFDHIGFI